MRNVIPWFERLLQNYCAHGLCAVLALTLLPMTVTAQGRPVNTGLPLVELRIKGHALKAEVAATGQARTIGLMNRFSLRPDHGMLFVFPQSEPLAFWMKNTYIPLSIAYIDEQGAIVRVTDMKPHDETPHPSGRPALYALEMKQGWFRERGIGAGDRVEGLAQAGQGKD